MLEKWFPSWMRESNQAEAIIAYHEGLLEENREIFEQAFDVLFTKAQTGLKFETKGNLPIFVRSCQVDISVSRDYREKKGGEIIIQKIFFEGDRLDGIVRSMQFVFLKDEWNSRQRKQVLAFSQRTLSFDLRKLANTALTLVEPNPPEERMWFRENGSYPTDDPAALYSADVPQALRALMEEVENWKPVEPYT